MSRELKEDNHLKIGEAVKGKKAIIHDLEGNVIVGEIVYVRKAVYTKDPFLLNDKKPTE